MKKVSQRDIRNQSIIDRVDKKKWHQELNKLLSLEWEMPCPENIEFPVFTVIENTYTIPNNIRLYFCTTKEHHENQEGFNYVVDGNFREMKNYILQYRNLRDYFFIPIYEYCRYHNLIEKDLKLPPLIQEVCDLLSRPIEALLTTK